MTDPSVRAFYDHLAADYHLLFRDWDAGIGYQAATLDALLHASLGPGPHRLLDCSCGIGTQAIGLARAGHRVTGTDLSPLAAARAAAEAAAREVPLLTAAADMRRLPFPPAAFDGVVCADNSLPHLLTAADVRTALTDMARVLRDDGVLLLTVRPYDDLRRTRPASTPPQVTQTPVGRAVSFQLWHWHEDGERYDLEHFQLIPKAYGSDDMEVRVRRTTYWALTADRLTEFVTAAGFTEVTWHAPAASGYYQPVLTARRGPAHSPAGSSGRA